MNKNFCLEYKFGTTWKPYIKSESLGEIKENLEFLKSQKDFQDQEFRITERKFNYRVCVI